MYKKPVFDVIITCSGLGSRLKPITNYLNKALIKVGDKAILSHILESYPKDCRFIVTLGYLSQQVKDYITINHSDLNVVYVEVDDYDGADSSLLYSLSKTFPLINKPFIYNSCDTFIDSHISFKKNTAVVSKTFIDNQYRSLKQNICDVPAKSGELCYTGVCYIENFEIFKSLSNNLLQNKNKTLSDAHVIQQMNMDFVETDKWFDIGNFISLEYTKKLFKNEICVLDKNDQETYLVNGKILKFFKEEQKTKQILERSQDLIDCVPECKKLGNYIYYDWIEGTTLSQNLSVNNLNLFLNWCENKLWISKKNEDENFFYDFYVKKAYNRTLQYIEINPEYFKSVINFRKVKNIFKLLSEIPCHYFDNCICTQAHGDLVFENVIKTKNDFKLIDWRENFDPCKGSDMLYDIAKMKHNLYFDHKVIKNKDYFLKEIKDEMVMFNSNAPTKNTKLIKTLDLWCQKKGIDIKIVDLIVALIQISSSPLHTGSESQLLFYMGWYNLNQLMEKQ